MGEKERLTTDLKKQATSTETQPLSRGTSPPSSSRKAMWKFVMVLKGLRSSSWRGESRYRGGCRVLVRLEGGGAYIIYCVDSGLSITPFVATDHIHHFHEDRLELTLVQPDASDRELSAVSNSHHT